MGLKRLCDNFISKNRIGPNIGLNCFLMWNKSFETEHQFVM